MSPVFVCPQYPVQRLTHLGTQLMSGKGIVARRRTYEESNLRKQRRKRQTKNDLGEWDSTAREIEKVKKGKIM